MNKEQYLTLYSCCQFVAGAKRALLLDTQRGKYFLIPLEVKEFAEAATGRDINVVLNELLPDEREIALEYINFLTAQDCAFFCDTQEEAACFTPLNSEWDYPAIITNAVIEIKEQGQVPTVIKFFEGHFIPCLQLSLYCIIDNTAHLNTIIEMFSRLYARGLRVLLHNNGSFTPSNLRKLCNENPLIDLLAVFGSERYEVQTENGATVLFTPQKGFSPIHCGLIGKEHFNLSLTHFTESQHHNTCLNRKISIDANGDIKNCPSMPESYGNIKDTNLQEAIEKPGFKSTGTLPKIR